MVSERVAMSSGVWHWELGSALDSDLRSKIYDCMYVCLYGLTMIPPGYILRMDEWTLQGLIYFMVSFSRVCVSTCARLRRCGSYDWLHLLSELIDTVGIVGLLPVLCTLEDCFGFRRLHILR